MFGLFQAKLGPVGPIEFEAEYVIERPAEEVYPLIDWADPRNAKRALGHAVTPLATPGRFRLELASLPGHRFDMTVSEAEPPASYAYSTEIAPRIGKLTHSHERYTFTPEGPGACRVRLVTTACFVEGMREKQLAREMAIMTLSCRNALVKLKLQLEQGIDAVHAADQRLVA